MIVPTGLGPAQAYMARLALGHGLHSTPEGTLSYLWVTSDPTGRTRLYAGFESPTNAVGDHSADQPVIPVTGAALAVLESLVAQAVPGHAPWTAPVLAYHPIATRSAHARMQARDGLLPINTPEAMAKATPHKQPLDALLFQLFWAQMDSGQIAVV